MSELKSIIKEEGTYYWATDEPLSTNELNMHDFIDNHIIDDDIDVILHDGTYAEIDLDGKIYEVHASGNGDFCNHKVEFKESK